MNTYFHKFYRLPFIPIRIRNYLWKFLRRLYIDRSWLFEFLNYWQNVIKGRPVYDIYDLFYLRSMYRYKTKWIQIPDIDDSSAILEAWQQPEMLSQLLRPVCKQNYVNKFQILNIFKKKEND